MSNPGVLTLTQKTISANKKFRVEDNLGESIHFHYNDIRIDLTIKELLYLSEICDEVIYELVMAKGFSLDEYDGEFLNKYSQCFIDLESVEEDKVLAGDLYYRTKNFLHLPVRRKMTTKRAEKLVKSKGGAGASKDYKVVLFNDNPTIMYGEKFVAEQLLRDSDQPVQVLRMHYENQKYSEHQMPWIPFLFKWDKKRLIHTAKTIAMKLLK